MKVFFKLIVISMTLFCFIDNARAQTYADFARYFSQTNIGGTARIQAIGGAQTSLGGDASSILSNPAGLGFYNRSEFSITPSINFYNNESEYLGNTIEENSTNFMLANIGIVLNNPKENPGSGDGWIGGSFGISISKINDFNNTVSYGGSNNEGDFVGYALKNIYYDEDNYIAFDNVYAELAYEVYLLNEYELDDGTFILDRYNIDPAFPVQQRENITTSGSTSQVTFAYGGNFSDRFYIGANIGISSLNYRQERLYTESPTGTSLDNLVLSEDREISGSGFNLRLGAIYRPINQLTIGLSYKSPTYYNLEDASVIDLIANFSDSSSIYGVEYSPFEYNLKTPGHVNAGITYFFDKNGFISADLGYIDYSGNNFSGGDGFFDIDNKEINNTFKPAINYRVGGEYRFKIFRFRAGYAFYDDPLEGIDGLDRSRQAISAGFGLKWKRYFVDIAVVNSWQNSSVRPYAEAPLAIIDNSSTRALLTFGTNW